MKELQQIQRNLVCRKNKRNAFGGYNYRSCEDIMDAVKPLLDKNGCTLVVSDDIEEHGGRIYLKATATITNEKGESVSTTAYAREEEQKKGMDVAQITGSASSYARKYALNGLFCIDDTADPDTMDNRDLGTKPQAQPAVPTNAIPTPTPTPAPMAMEDIFDIEQKIRTCKTAKELGELWHSISQEEQRALSNSFSHRKAEILLPKK